MLKKFFLLALCSTTIMFAMDTQKPASLCKAFVVVMDYDHVICLNDASRPGQLHLPGGIVASDKAPIEEACKYLEQQTGICINTDVLDFIAQSTRVDVPKQKLLELYYLVENHRLQPSKEDADDLYTVHKSVDALAAGEPYCHRLDSKLNLQVGATLQKIAKHIKNGCVQHDEQAYLENISQPDCKTQLELFPKKKAQ